MCCTAFAVMGGECLPWVETRNSSIARQTTLLDMGLMGGPSRQARLVRDGDGASAQGRPRRSDVTRPEGDLLAPTPAGSLNVDKVFRV